MRYHLSLGLFAIALVAVTQAHAQGRYWTDQHPRVARAEPPPVAYAPRRGRPQQERDALQIASIASHWRWAAATQDRHELWVADRRLDDWLSREMRQSVRQPHDRQYAARLRALNEELIRLERQQHRGSKRGYYPKKARILDELVELAEWQAKRARGHHRDSMRLSFAVR